MKGPKTKNLSGRETAWFQLISAAGTLLDRIQPGKVTEKNLADAWILRDAVNRVIEVEGMVERPDTGEYEVVVEREDQLRNGPAPRGNTPSTSSSG